MSHTADWLIKSFQMSIGLLDPLPHTVLPYIPPQIGGRKAVKWGTSVVHHTASLYHASTPILWPALEK